MYKPLLNQMCYLADLGVLVKNPGLFSDDCRLSEADEGVWNKALGVHRISASLFKKLSQ